MVIFRWFREFATWKNGEGAMSCRTIMEQVSSGLRGVRPSFNRARNAYLLRQKRQEGSAASNEEIKKVTVGMENG